MCEGDKNNTLIQSSSTHDINSFLTFAAFLKLDIYK